MEETFPQVSGPPGNAAVFQAEALPLDEKTPRRIFIDRL
jgi:hypothetical protein